MLNKTQDDLALMQFTDAPCLSVHETFTIFMTTSYFILGFPLNLILIVYFIIKRWKLSSAEWNKESKKSISIGRNSVERRRANFQRSSSLAKTSNNRGNFEGNVFFLSQ